MQGTELVNSCQDELSTASGRLALSDLNASWGDALSMLAQREEDLKNRLALAESYQVKLSGFYVQNASQKCTMYVIRMVWDYNVTGV